MRKQRHEMLTDIDMECVRQEMLGKPMQHSDAMWFAIVAMELGEVAEHICRGGEQSEIDYELKQVAAVIVSWLCDQERKEVKS